MVFIDANDLPEEYKIEDRILKIGDFLWFPSAMSILFFQFFLVIFSFYWIIPLVIMVVLLFIGVIFHMLGEQDVDNQMKKLLETYLPSDLSRLPMIDGVRIFELGKYLSGVIIECPNCQLLMEKDAKYCKECGTKQE